jgi:thymidylate synthase (FAD)
MRVIKPSVEILDELDGQEILKRLEFVSRCCYKDASHAEEEHTAERLIASLIRRGHEFVLEHVSVSARFIVDRGVSHDIVRYRIASYAQESTRYCTYAENDFSTEITVIKPVTLEEGTKGYKHWLKACQKAEEEYFYLLDYGLSAQEARVVLPHSIKTDIVVTMNLREWRHFLRLAAAPSAHPQMREVTLQLLNTFKEKIPVVFEDI